MRDLQDIEAKLKENKDLLRERFKVKEIGIFGSFVRGEQKETSDLDILVDFEGRVGLFEIVRQKFLERDTWREGGPCDEVGLSPG